MPDPVNPNLDALRRALSRSVGAVQDKTHRDDKDRKEENAASLRERAETQTIVESNRDLKVNRKLRWKYARWVFCYLVSYSVVVTFIIVLAGFGICGFSLPEQVLSYLVGSTAASAIGLVLAVTTGLFNKK